MLHSKGNFLLDECMQIY